MGLGGEVDDGVGVVVATAQVAVAFGSIERIDRDAVTASAGDLGSLSAALDNGWTTSLKGER